MQLELTRTYYPRGTNGLLTYNGRALCHSIELPWKSNAHAVSCIPEGRYALEKRYSPHLGWHLTLIHPANNAATELRGCIAPVDLLTAPGCGLRSRVAFNRLTALLFPALERPEEVWLVVQPYYSPLNKRK